MPMQVSNMQGNATNKTKILFLAANPIDTDRLRLGQGNSRDNSEDSLVRISRLLGVDIRLGGAPR